MSKTSSNSPNNIVKQEKTNDDPPSLSQIPSGKQELETPVLTQDQQQSSSQDNNNNTRWQYSSTKKNNNYSITSHQNEIPTISNSFTNTIELQNDINKNNNNNNNNEKQETNTTKWTQQNREILKDIMSALPATDIGAAFRVILNTFGVEQSKLVRRGDIVELDLLNIQNDFILDQLWSYCVSLTMQYQQQAMLIQQQQSNAFIIQTNNNNNNNNNINNNNSIGLNVPQYTNAINPMYIPAQYNIPVQISPVNYVPNIPINGNNLPTPNSQNIPNIPNIGQINNNNNNNIDPNNHTTRFDYT